ncbi:U3 small nucleolar RNA-interacting protein 2 [Chionoecetes opilio]|uniref:U3 small nucleolar RNA-interacting protein 2 n=1 Tax=Chionoecetes opilio TaxID=41210 RepID=A0A8J4Y5B6_CHIOP|nr:U3 small nucleolar RNA-interacting protein 2 [Chionoecetes opilio]
MNFPETIEHFLLQCPHFHSHRVVLQSQLLTLNVTTFDLPTLLAAAGVPPSRQHAVIRLTCAFLRKTVPKVEILPKERHPSLEKPLKRKLQEKRKAETKSHQLEKKGKYTPNLDEEITSEEEEDYKKKKVNEEEEELEEETAQEKKVRLARQYLQQLQEQRAQDEEGELDDEAIQSRLREDVLEASGRLRKKVAESYLRPADEDRQVLRSKKQKLSVTCIAVSIDEKYIFSGSKDCSIAKYSISGEKLGAVLGGRKGTEDKHIGHTSHIYSIAISSDGKFLASGDAKGCIHIWNPETLEHLKTFKKHRGAISGLAFRWATHTLFSGSHDRMVMVWNLDAMAFVENLGGHQDAITGLDAFMRESCITSGGRDKSVIVYVLVEDKQLRFSGHQDSIDGVKLINEKTFVSYGQDGCMALWTTLKKRPHCVVKAAHGYQGNGLPNWLTAVAALINTDVIASGSMDGYVRLWKVDTDGHKTLKQLFSIPVLGVINSLAFTTSGSHLLVGVGQEHKCGRWYREKVARNSVVVIPLKKE